MIGAWAQRWAYMLATLQAEKLLGSARTGYGGRSSSGTTKSIPQWCYQKSRSDLQWSINDLHLRWSMFWFATPPLFRSSEETRTEKEKNSAFGDKLHFRSRIFKGTALRFFLKHEGRIPCYSGLEFMHLTPNNKAISRDAAIKRAGHGRSMFHFRKKP